MNVYSVMINDRELIIIASDLATALSIAKQHWIDNLSASDKDKAEKVEVLTTRASLMCGVDEIEKI